MKRICRLRRIFFYSYLGPQPSSNLMIVHHAHLRCVASLPAKYDSPLIVDSDRIKPSPFTFEWFKSITRISSTSAQVTV